MADEAEVKMLKTLLAEARARAETAEREANAYLGAIGGMKRERDALTAQRDALAEALRHQRWRNHEFSMGCSACAKSDELLAALAKVQP